MAKTTNPKQMTDEELEEAIANPVIEPVVPEEEPQVEEVIEPVTPPAEVPEEVVEPPVEPPVEEEEEKPVSRRESLRIQDLLAKMKEVKPEASRPVPDAIDYTQALDADPELIKKLQEDRDKTNNAFYQQGLEQSKSLQFHTRLEIDAPRAEAKYPQLDKTNEKEFNPVLANAINTMFLDQVGYNSQTDTVRSPNIRYIDYVDSIFELADEIAGEKTASASKNIIKQAAQTGIRPGGSGTKKMNLNKAPSQMSDEELDAVIALAVPSK